MRNDKHSQRQSSKPRPPGNQRLFSNESRPREARSEDSSIYIHIYIYIYIYIIIIIGPNVPNLGFRVDFLAPESAPPFKTAIRSRRRVAKSPNGDYRTPLEKFGNILEIWNLGSAAPFITLDFEHRVAQKLHKSILLHWGK